jgi:hypothetical protein
LSGGQPGCLVDDAGNDVPGDCFVEVGGLVDNATGPPPVEGAV